MKLLLQAPHRLLFVAGVVQLLAVSAWWAAALGARLLGMPLPAAPELEPPRVHALLMLYGFFPLFILGFLITAGPRWLDEPQPRLRDHSAGAAATALGALLLVPALAFDRGAALAAGALYAAGWLWLLARFTRLVAASRARSRMHAIAAAAALTAGLGGLASGLAWLATGAPAAALAMEAIGLWGFLVPLFCTVCHRMIPFFTSTVVAGHVAFRPPWVLAALVGGSLAHGLLEGLGMRPASWVVDAPLAALALALAWRWGLAHSFAHRLLAMMHVGFLWLGAAYTLYAVASLADLAGAAGIGLAPAHAMTVGFLASLTIAMVSRVAGGPPARSLATDDLTLAAFVLLQVAALTRVTADLWPGAYGQLLVLAALLWTGCFALWGWRYFATQVAAWRR